MLILLPLCLNFILYLIIKNNELNNQILIQYNILMILLYNYYISIGINYIFINFLILLIYWCLNENNLLYTQFLLLNSIFIFYSNSLYSIFLSIELISFIMITYINLYINQKYPGILYYLFSGIFTSIFILAIGYLNIGINISYQLISLVFIWKLGLGPLHILMPNIYNLLSPSKIIYIDILMKYLLFYIFSKLFYSISINLNFIIFLSILIGTFLILNNNNLLNIIIYSSIINYGLILILIYNLNLYFIYLFYYSIFILLFFYLIIHIHIHYSINNTYYKILWSILIFNLMGIPPLTGFWMKLLVCKTLIFNENYILLLFIILSFIIISGIYLKILLAIWLNTKYINIYIINKNTIITHLISCFTIIILLSPLVI